MSEISRGTAAEFDEIIDFIDFVFSKASCPHDFPGRYPNMYRRTDEAMHNMICLREDGEIRGCIIALPRVLKIGGEELKIVGIGNVATHPRFTGRGYMSAMMNFNNEEMRRDGVHLSNLGGMRSRYNHFGYDYGGNCCDIASSYNAFRSAMPGYTPKFELTPFTKDDTEIIDAVKAIYDAKPMHYIYDRDGFALRFWNMFGNMVYVVRGLDGTIEGFLATRAFSPDKTGVRELTMRNDGDFADALYSFMAQYKSGFSVNIPEAQLSLLGRIPEFGSVPGREDNGMWQILRYPETVRALLRRKAEYANLEPGTLVFDIPDHSRFAVEVTAHSVDVVETKAAPDITLPYFRSIRALTGPIPEAEFGFRLDAPLRHKLTSWFPLPLTWQNLETV